MNAKQVADELENIYWIQGDGKGKPFQQYADFVRQQQAEYYSLLVNHDKLYAKVVEQQAEIEALKAKTLTDEEIIEIWSGMETDTGEQNIAFARAILKKAQNK